MLNIAKKPTPKPSKVPVPVAPKRAPKPMPMNKQATKTRPALSFLGILVGAFTALLVLFLDLLFFAIEIR